MEEKKKTQPTNKVKTNNQNLTSEEKNVYFKTFHVFVLIHFNL